MSKLLEESTNIQTLIISKEVFPTVDDARKWVIENGFKDDNVDETEESYLFKQKDSDDFQDDSLETVEITDGVTAIVGELKEQEPEQEPESKEEPEEPEEKPENDSDEENNDDDEKELQDGHIHELPDGTKTSPDIVTEGVHVHTVGEVETSATENTEGHTHMIVVDGEDLETGAPILPEKEAVEEEGKEEEKEESPQDTEEVKELLKKKKFDFIYDLASVKFQDAGKSVWIQLMVTIDKHVHPSFGELTITNDDLEGFKKNFEQGVRGKELPIDYFHENGQEAAGWINQLDIRNEGTELWGFVEFTPRAVKQIKEKEIRFFSPEFIEQFKTKTGEVIKNVLFGGGLTNRPFLDMAPVTLSENFSFNFKQSKVLKNKPEKGEEKITMTELKLAEKNAELTNQLSTLESEKKELSESNVKLETEKKELSEKMEKIEADTESKAFDVVFEKLLNEGKLLDHMKEVYSDKFSSTELEEFGAKLPKVVKLDEEIGDAGKDATTLSEAEAKLVKDGVYTKEQIVENRKV